VADRLIPGHCEGELIKGAGNRSSVGTLVERTSGFVVLAKMCSATAAAAFQAFGDALERIPPALRKIMTYDQGQGADRPRSPDAANRHRGVLR
jgi:IS30 family transposase